MRKKHIFKLGLLAGALALSQGVWALGLGKMTVKSYLGHPLAAEIELMGTKEEFADLKANIASPNVYQQRNLVYQAALARTQVAVEQRADGSAYLKIASPQSVAEPYLDLLIEVAWSTGHALREYTLLLDPPKVSAPEPIIPAQQATAAGRAETRAQTPAAAESASAPQKEKGAAERRANLRAKPPTAPSGQGAATAGDDNTYTVERGDTLTDIANTFKPQEVSLEQALVALYQANPKAFQGKNMNRLRAGAILEIPDANTFADTAQSEARKIVRVQVGEWRNYRNALAARSPTDDEQTGTQTTTGTITPSVTEEGHATPSGDRLEVSAGSSVSGKEGSATQASAQTSEQASENMVALQKALGEEHDRVKALEKTVNDLKTMLDIKNQQLAELQEQAKQTVGQQAPPPQEVEVVVPPQEVPQEVPPLQASQTTDTQTTAQSQADAEAQAQRQVEAEAQRQAEADEAQRQAEAQKQAEAQQQAEKQQQTTQQQRQRRPASPPPVAGPSLLDKAIGFAKDSWFFLVAILAVLAAIIGYFIYRRRQSEYEAIDSMFGATTTADGAGTMTSSGSTFSSTSTAAAPPMGHGAAMSSAAASNTAGSNSILSEFSREGLGSIDTGEVDPLAEADVYLAYGRAQQAEEILRDALNRENDRQDVALKLLEVLAEQKKTQEFEAEADKLYSLSGGQGEYWQRAADIGRRLMPNNPRFTGITKAPPDINDFIDSTTTSRTATKTAAFVPAEPLGFGSAASLDPRAFSPMESESVAEAIARAASEKMNQETLPPGGMSDSRLSMPGQQSGGGFSFDFDTPSQQGQHEDLGVDLDFEELSRFRNFGKAGEQVDLGGGTTLPGASVTHPTTTRPSTITQTPMTTTPTFTQGQPSNLKSMHIDDAGLSLEESVIDDQSIIDDRGVPLGYEGQWQDVATKLDLARAYQATGDIEACRDILQEVLKEGDDQQKAEARAILEKL